METEKKYYGPWEIASEAPVEGRNQVVLTFAPTQDAAGMDYTPPSLVVSLTAYPYSITAEPTDWTAHTKARLKPLVAKILELMLEHNTIIGTDESVMPDIHYIFQMIQDSMIGERRAIHDHLWGAPERLKTMQQLEDHFQSYLNSKEQK